MKTFVKKLNQTCNYNHSFAKIISKSISAKDVKINSTSTSYHVALDPTFNPKEEEMFQKEYFPSHPNDKKLEKIKVWGKAPYNLGLFDETRDTELKRFAWNTNGYFNNISKVLYRSKFFQSPKVLRFFMKNFNHRFAMEINKAEEPPKLTTNSIFLYKDSTNATLSRRGMERLIIFAIITQAFNVPTAVMYLFVAFYFNLLQSYISSNQEVH